MTVAVSTNRFDAKAATWDDLDPDKVQRAKDVAVAIGATVSLDRSMRMLEYGAGTGLVTQALRDAVGPVTMVDTFEGDPRGHARQDRRRSHHRRPSLGPGPSHGACARRALRSHRDGLDAPPHPGSRRRPRRLRRPPGRRRTPLRGGPRGRGRVLPWCRLRRPPHGFRRSTPRQSLAAAGFSDVAFQSCPRAAPFATGCGTPSSSPPAFARADHHPSLRGEPTGARDEIGPPTSFAHRSAPSTRPLVGPAALGQHGRASATDQEVDR